MQGNEHLQKAQQHWPSTPQMDMGVGQHDTLSDIPPSKQHKHIPSELVAQMKHSLLSESELSQERHFVKHFSEQHARFSAAAVIMAHPLVQFRQSDSTDSWMPHGLCSGLQLQPPYAQKQDVRASNSPTGATTTCAGEDSSKGNR